MPGRNFRSEDLDAGDVNRNQNKSQHEHAQPETHGDKGSQINVHAGRRVDEATGELGAENRNNAKQRKTEKLEESAKINPEGLNQNVSARRLARRFLISDLRPLTSVFKLHRRALDWKQPRNFGSRFPKRFLRRKAYPSRVDICRARRITRQNAPVILPITQGVEIGRTVFLILNSNDPLVRHCLIMRYSASRIQNRDEVTLNRWALLRLPLVFRDSEPVKLT